MYFNLHYSDLTLLLNKGFTFGIADSILWGTDKSGTEWQAYLDGNWFKFAQRLPAGNTLGARTMSNDEFYLLF